jgi:nitrate/TMAO reductase-like tetraheme cytochrome c subunit
MRNGTLRGNIIARLWRWFWRPAGLISFGLLLVVGFGGGIVFWGGFHWALEITNTEQFCISCHEMRDNVYAEYVGSVHDANASGVRATCPDCHVPKPWAYKMKRKIQASNEVLHKVLGSIDTREKFEAKRLELATHVWVAMKETDSRECRNAPATNTRPPRRTARPASTATRASPTNCPKAPWIAPASWTRPGDRSKAGRASAGASGPRPPFP